MAASDTAWRQRTPKEAGSTWVNANSSAKNKSKPSASSLAAAHIIADTPIPKHEACLLFREAARPLTDTVYAVAEKRRRNKTGGPPHTCKKKTSY